MNPLPSTQVPSKIEFERLDNAEHLQGKLLKREEWKMRKPEVGRPKKT